MPPKSKSGSTTKQPTKALQQLKLDSEDQSSESEEESLESDQDSEEELDEVTESLFEQLEDGYKESRGTDIAQTIRDGADVYAKKNGDLPIHVAAQNSGANTAAIGEILASFSDSAERLEYLKLRDENDENALDILATFSDQSLGFGSNIEDIRVILSYLEPEEQKQYVQQTLDDKRDDIPEYTLEFLEEIVGGKAIPLCEQRKRENAALEAGYDSGDEALGFVEDVKSKKGFVTRVYYEELELEDGLVKSVPMMELIPSSWRLQTATEDNNQGDHVIAYVLLLQSLAHCRGENIKTLPEHFYTMASALLPDDRQWFLDAKNEVVAKVAEKAEARKSAVANLKHVVGVDEKTLSTIEDSLKKAEIEEVARHIEKVADYFIGSVNKLKGESFPQSRKEGVNRPEADGKGIVTKKMLSLVDVDERISGAEFQNFRTKLKAAIEHELQGKLEVVSGANLESIAADAIDSIDEDLDEVPEGLKSKTNLVKFLSTITPLKKYHEGNAMDEIAKMVNELKYAEDEDREFLVERIGSYCAQLFDYPRVNRSDKQCGEDIERVDDEYVLCEAIPRHLIVIFSAFSSLKDELTTEEKNTVRDVFLDQILKLQLWEGHPVKDKDGNEANLTRGILIGKISQFANCVDGNFSMKHSDDYPDQVYSDRRKPVEYDLKRMESLVNESIGAKGSIKSWQRKIEKLSARKNKLSEVVPKLTEELGHKDDQYEDLQDLLSILEKTKTSLDGKAGYNAEKAKVAEFIDRCEDFKEELEEAVDAAEKRLGEITAPKKAVKAKAASKLSGKSAAKKK
jgi:hypothetical protein